MLRITMLAAAVAAIGLGLAPSASAAPTYTSCAQAAQDGVYNIPESSPDYNPKLDRDGDGVACEQN